MWVSIFYRLIDTIDFKKDINRHRTSLKIRPRFYRLTDIWPVRHSKLCTISTVNETPERATFWTVNPRPHKKTNTTSYINFNCLFYKPNALYVTTDVCLLLKLIKNKSKVSPFGKLKTSTENKEWIWKNVKKQSSASL